MQYLAQIIIEVILLPYVFLLAFISRYKEKKVDIGLGPEPLINNIYHKKALSLYGYKVETFVTSSYFITSDFDINLSENYNVHTIIGKFGIFFSLLNLAFKYKVLYFYFNGGPFGVTNKLLWYFEPLLYKIAKVKTVLMPYGGDIQDMTRCNNLYFKHVLSKDYPIHKTRRKLISKKIDLWTKHANHVISGCDWVDYMYAWDTLLVAHFSIEIKHTDQVIQERRSDKTFKVFHAPNHTSIKGTSHLIKAIDTLTDEGYQIELIMLQGVSNEKILETIAQVDLVADQFVIGWYAMFTLEAMSLGKPVMCYLREDLVELYTKANLLQADEIPIINTDIEHIKENLIWAYENKELLKERAQRSQQYVQEHHSLEYIGSVFDNINKALLD